MSGLPPEAADGLVGWRGAADDPLLPFVVQLEISLDIEFADKKNEHINRANDAGACRYRCNCRYRFLGLELRQSTHRLNVLWRSIQIQSAEHQQVIADDADHLIVL